MMSDADEFDGSIRFCHVSTGTENKYGFTNILLFGRTVDGKSATVIVKRFKPWIVVEKDVDIKNLNAHNHITTSAYRYDAYYEESGKRKKFDFRRIYFKNSYEWYNAKESLGNKIIEDKATIELQFYDLKKFIPCSNVLIKNLNKIDNEFSTDEIYEVDLSMFWSEPIKDLNIPLKVMMFDIEVYSQTGAFPCSSVVTDVIFQISVVTEIGAHRVKKILCLKETLCNDDSIDVICFETEKELIAHFQKTISTEDPDIISGYNVNGFDYRYIWDRAEILNLTDWNTISRTRKGTELRRMNQQSAALGDIQSWVPKIPGRCCFDLYQYIKRSFQFDSYKLDNVGKVLCDHGKIDMPPKMIFEKFRGTPEDRGEVAYYCVVDSELCLDIINKIDLVTQNIGLSNLTYCNLETILTRGQQIRIYSCLYIYAHQLGFILTKPSGNVENYEGATVLDPVVGHHTDPVCCLDFASLYPSCQRELNLCPSSLVRPGDVTTMKTNDILEYRFIKDDPGVIPRLLTDLITARKKTKQAMKTASGQERKNLDAMQLAQKVVCNSIYGFCGAQEGYLPCMPIARSTTARGRQLIEYTKNYCEKEYALEVVYGDSVADYSPVFLLTPDGFNIDAIDRIAEKYGSGKWKDYGCKQICKLSQDVSVWTETGFTPLVCVIRHKLKKTKKMFRVFTTTGIVDVTDDHSLLDHHGNPITSIEVGKSLNTNKPIELLTSDLPTMDKCFTRHIAQLSPGITDDEAEIFGYFNTDYEIPRVVFNGTLEARRGFCEGLLYHTPTPTTIYTNTQTQAAHLYWVFDTSGYNCKTVFENGRFGIYITGSITGSLDSPPRRGHVIKIEEIQYSGYVYDLTTSNHHFQAGIGKIIVHNTDSVFVKFPGRSVDEASNLAQHLEVELNKYFDAHCRPQAIEYEKIYKSLVFQKKKRYCGLYAEYDPRKSTSEITWSLDSKGIELKRRDTLPFLKTLLYDVILTTLNDGLSNALPLIESKLIDILEDRVSFDDFVLSKSLKSQYKSEKVAQFIVAQKILQRGEREPPNSGDRVPYVLAYRRGTDKVCDCVEDAVYAKEHDVKLDYIMYIKTYIGNPLNAFLEVCGSRKVQDVFKLLIAKIEAKVRGEQVLRFDEIQDNDANEKTEEGQIYSTPEQVVNEVECTVIKRAAPPQKRRKKMPFK